MCRCGYIIMYNTGNTRNVGTTRNAGNASNCGNSQVHNYVHRHV